MGKHETGHIGYRCAREARGRGTTTRALRRLFHYALEELRLERLDLFTDVENLASQRVAQKVGFRREGIVRSHLRHPDGHRRDSVFFSVLPGELRDESGAAPARLSADRRPAPLLGGHVSERLRERPPVAGVVLGAVLPLAVLEVVGSIKMRAPCARARSQ